MTPQQMIDLAYVIFAKQPILQQDLRLWNRKPLLDKTWTNMIQHLRDAQTDLSSLPAAGDIYHQQAPHQANVATMAELVAQRLLEDQNILQTAYHNTAPPIDHPALPSPSTPPNEVANSLQRRETDLQTRESAMLTQMQEMMMNMMRNNNNNNNSNANTNGYYHNNNNTTRSSGRGRGRGRGRGNDRTNSRTQSRGYCWTHGACAHPSSRCNTPADGHISSATFDNMQNGSKNGCYWLST